MTNIPSLSELTTFRLGGTPASYEEASTTPELIEALRAADAEGKQVLLLGGGSNLVIGDGPLDMHVIAVRNRDVHTSETADGVRLTVGAGHPWDEFVQYTVDQGLSGVEALSGIPGCVGSTPIQNVGAYGQDVSATVTAVHAYDRAAARETFITPEACAFAYRDSYFKQNPQRYAILNVEFTLTKAETSPVAYAGLAAALGCEVGAHQPLGDIRQAVLSVRASKGMVSDAADHDTWSAGSFFTNPFVAEGTLPDGAPAYPSGKDGLIKTSAAWLIEHAGFTKGFSVGPNASLSTKHTLALTNRGGASAMDVLELAATVRNGVKEKFGILLEPEPRFVACELPATPGLSSS